MSARDLGSSWLGVGLAGLGLVLAPVFGRAQGPAEDAASREEQILRLVRSIAEARDRDEPNVLGTVDPSTAPAQALKVARVLRSTPVDLKLEKTPVADVLKLLHAVSGLPFLMSAKAREAAAAEKLEVTFSVSELPLENVLNLLAIQLGAYRFVVRYGAVVLVRADEHRPKTILRVYDVSDVVRARPDFPAPRLGLDTGEKS
ncbi:MAG: hypothetical protein HY721_35450 [Planctomycetes bacterium]|nr:hypothetical protein [Planctomycetota bacterium]